MEWFVDDKKYNVLMTYYYENNTIKVEITV